MSAQYSIKDIRNLIKENSRYSYGLDYEEEYFVFSDGEIEYQLRGFGLTEDCIIRSILVRFCDDDTHTYSEFFFDMYEDPFTFLDDVFKEDVLERLEVKAWKKKNK